MQDSFAGTRGIRSRAAVLAVCLAVGSACATQTMNQSPSNQDASAGVAPLLAVESFMAAANADDWDAMARLFGTRDGSYAEIGGDRQEVELRMNAIALILKHYDFEVVAQDRVPGRESTTIRVGVDVTNAEGTISDVGFLVVRSKDGPWLVEEIELVKLTAA